MFAADKLAALEVVKNRLEEKELGNFALRSTAGASKPATSRVKAEIKHDVQNFDRSFEDFEKPALRLS